MEVYSSSIALRALLFCNTSRSHGGNESSLGWKALHKPQWFSVVQKFNNGNMALRRCFPGKFNYFMLDYKYLCFDSLLLMAIIYFIF